MGEEDIGLGEYHLYKFYEPTLDNVADLINQEICLGKPLDFIEPLEIISFGKQELFYESIKKIFAQHGRECCSELVIASMFFENGEHNMKFGDLECAVASCSNKNGCHMYREVKREYNNRVEELKKYSDRIRVTGFHKFKNADFHRTDSLWSQYAANGQGFCVQYHYINANEAFEQKFYDVKYTDSVDFSKIENKIDAFLNSLTQKPKHWSYENEMRLILNNHELVNDKVSFPYAETIYIGKNASDSLKTILHELHTKQGIDLVMI